MKRQAGQAFAYVLILLTVGSFAIIPNLEFLYTAIVGQRVMEEYVSEQYAADAALEDAFWQIMNDNLLDSLDPDTNPELNYNFQPDFFDEDVPVTITYAEAPPSDWVGDSERRMRIKSEVEPAWVEEASGSPQSFYYIFFADNQFTGIGSDSNQDDISILIPGPLQYDDGTSEYIGPISDVDTDDPDSWPPFQPLGFDPEQTLVDGETWQDGDITWTQIASSTDTEVIDVLGDEQVVLATGSFASLEHTYNFSGVTTSNHGENGYPIAFEHDSDTFPWTASNQQSTSINPDDTEYANISADDSAWWRAPETGDSGNNDIMAITYSFFIEEEIGEIADIEITWNGHSTAASDHSIWLRKDGLDEFGGASTWVQLGSALPIPQNVDTDLTESMADNLITDFATYVNGTTGQFEFVIINDIDLAAMRTDYVQIKVIYEQPIYDTPGEIVSNSITFPDVNIWWELSFNDTEPAGTDIIYQIQYWDGDSWEMVPDGALSGNSTGFDSSPVNLTSVNGATYDTVRLKATLSTTDTYITPAVDDWQITAMDSDAQRKLTWYYDPALGIGGRQTYILRFTVNGNPTWGLHYAEPQATFRPSGGIITGPTGPISVALYHVSIEAGGKTLKAVISYTESGEIKIVSYLVYS
ncbi:hypothetical protein ACFLWJ_00885 [Chloroflexota bacterium]